jgi:uncharacterized YccA/Bax inhibitor family protein
MAFFRTSNPALRGNAFSGADTLGPTMTLNGTIHKTGILLLLCVAAAAWTWNLPADEVQMWMIGGLIGGFIVSMIAIFARRTTPFTAPIYAVLEGLALGGISGALNQAYQGIAIQAVSITFAALFVMLALYRTGIVRATPAFTRGVIIATGAIAIVYVLDMVLGIFGHSIPMINGSTTFGIGFSIFVVILATLNLVLDFSMIEQGAQQGAPKYMEWYGAFSIMVTLVWLYLEILRLLAKMRDR